MRLLTSFQPYEVFEREIEWQIVKEQSGLGLLYLLSLSCLSVKGKIRYLYFAFCN